MANKEEEKEEVKKADDSISEKARKAAEEKAKKAAEAEKRMEQERGARIETRCIRDCVHGGFRWRRDRPGPLFYGKITSPHFVKA